MVRRINLEHPHQEPSFKRTNQLFIPASVKRPFKRRSSMVSTCDVVLNDKCGIVEVTILFNMQ
jgi:hypothetical protein